MTLSEKRCEFSRLISQLVIAINAMPGYRACFGEVLRTLQQAAAYASEGIGIKNSDHVLGLAADLQIFKDGVFLTKSEDYEFAGSLWKSYSHDDIECCWGGDFQRPDGDHFSLEHNGVK